MTGNIAKTETNQVTTNLTTTKNNLKILRISLKSFQKMKDLRLKKILTFTKNMKNLKRT